MDRRKLPQIRLDAKPGGLTFRAPPSAVAKWDRAVAMAAKPAAGEVTITGYVGLGEITLDSVRKQLKAIGRRDVRVVLSSPGGDAFEGIAIYNELREHPGRVTIAVRGMAASAASVIAMAGDRIEIGEAALMMIHSAAGMVGGNAADLREFADLLDMIDQEVAQLYARRSGMALAEVLTLMRKETYLTGKQAVEKGFADFAYSDPDEKKKAGASMRSPLPALMSPELLAASGIPQSGVVMSANLSPGATGIFQGTEMTLQEKLAALREQKQARLARQSEIIQLMRTDREQVTVEMRGEAAVIDRELSTIDDDIMMAQYELRMAGEATPVTNDSRVFNSPASRGAPYLNLKNKDQDEKFKGQNWTRRVIAMALAHQHHCTAVDVAMARGWHKTNPTLTKLIQMAAVPGFGSDSGEPGSELVTADNRYTGDFIEFLYNMTVFDSLPLREVPANVAIKGTDGVATASWVGQSKAIPNSNGSASNVNLTPLKVAALSVISNELLADSTPSAEMWVRDLLAQAMAQRVDQTFFSADAAVSGVSPAGMLNGISALVSSGTDGDSVRTDIEILYAPFIAARNASDLVFVTSTGLAKAIQLMRNALGQREFPDVTSPTGARAGNLEGDPLYRGDNIGSGDVILLKPRDIWKIGDTGIQVAISREATIEQQDNPTGATDVPTGATTTNMTNMFQEDSTAIRLIRRINFQKRRPGAVAYIGNAGYGGVAS